MHKKPKRREKVSGKILKASNYPLGHVSSRQKRSYFTLEVKDDKGKKVSMGRKLSKIVVFLEKGKTRVATDPEKERYYKALARKERKQWH